MRYSIDTFIKKAREIHGDKYDYTNIKTIKYNEDVCIVCPKHGKFYIKPSKHINKGRTNQIGCPACGEENRRNHIRKTTEWFIENSQKIHGDKYDYSKVVYERTDKNVCIICHKKDENGNEHGEFWQTPNRHLCKHGCPKCGGSIKLTQEEFINRSNKVHNNKYDYSKTKFDGTSKKVCVICPKHGEFWQYANQHLQGRGCPRCNQSSLEKEVECFLCNENIKYISQKRTKWLGKQSLDFYLPEYNVAIECQGEQHFKPSEYFGGYERYEKTKELDLLKYNLCKEHNIEIIYYTHCCENYEFELIKNLESLKKKLYGKNQNLSKN